MVYLPTSWSCIANFNKLDLATHEYVGMLSVELEQLKEKAAAHKKR
jgi:hypothetical protein